MFETILVVCEGNICRSPIAAMLLRERLPGRTVRSAGLGALVGHDMAPDMRAIAEQAGVRCSDHSATQLDDALCHSHDLILVMERRHRERILAEYPGGGGKTFLLTQWNGGQDIPDPWRRDRSVYERAFAMIRESTDAWANMLDKKGTDQSS